MPSEDVIALIGDIRERAHRFIQQELDERGLRGMAPSHGAALSVLFRRGDVMMSELAELIRRDKSTLTTLVRKLEDHGYVTRRRDPKDGRIVHVSLTEAGRSLEPAFREISEALLKKTYEGYKQPEKEDLILHLERILKNLAAG